MTTSRALGASLLLAPLLLFASGLFSGALVDDMVWQGALGTYAGIAFIAANLTLSARIRRGAPRLGVANYLLSGVGAGMVASAFGSYLSTGLAGRVLGFAPREVLEQVANAAMGPDPHPGQFLTFIALTVPLSWIVLGVSLWLTRAAPRPCAVLISAGGVAFATAQAVLGATGELVSPALLLAGMGPIGLELARRGRLA